MMDRDTLDELVDTLIKAMQAASDLTETDEGFCRCCWTINDGNSHKDTCPFVHLNQDSYI